ncbi:hypothetical protein BABINDRAFT_177709 [Babjeviella inositovora NRRL Y-12698]|uniref:Intradiol ring-cleavage dioxygenases domain-containing protein n=1 Tax=Babjeviella inositovora NRRL Y-12698 TaxID=984486 RepID=A0A1E3QMB6_9ASCO|nr:uncharacterized protein BABINDRAFT_177709 [Babjeviella inositovora NRRL Y-12698]ODQ78127.1 hypothetical protein BABINDRAFT_177709 [Babjeviella inositovora NRRL Y-12698]
MHVQIRKLKMSCIEITPYGEYKQCHIQWSLGCFVFRCIIKFRLLTSKAQCSVQLLDELYTFPSTCQTHQILPLDIPVPRCCSPNGLYKQQDSEQPDFNLRGTFYTDKDGFYSFICLESTAYPIPYDGPADDMLQFMDRYPMRLSLIHRRVTHPSYYSLTIQIYNREDPYTEDDSVFTVKEDCVVDFIKADDKIAEEHQVEKELQFSVALELEDVQQEREKIYAQQKALEDHLHKKSRFDTI